MKILVCKHVHQEGLGYFESLFQDSGIDPDYQELYRDAKPRKITEYQGLVVMGGPMNVYQEAEFPFLKTDLFYIEEALKRNLPMLGFCLGAQLFSRVLGGRVVKNEQPELGWYKLNLVSKDNPLFNGFPDSFRVFEWHEDTFTIPPGGTLLAESNTCINQAFAWGAKVFGVQFHLELDNSMILEWLKDEKTINEWGFDTTTIVLETKKNLDAEIRLGKKMFENFRKILIGQNGNK